MYYNAYPSLKQYFIDVGNAAKEKGYILIDNVIGRKSYIEDFDRYLFLDAATDHDLLLYGDFHPTMGDKYRSFGAKIQRSAQNAPIQGTAANISKRAGIYLLEACEKYKNFKILLMIHDEYLLECKKEDATMVANILEQCMLRASKDFCTHLEIPGNAIISNHWSK